MKPESPWDRLLGILGLDPRVEFTAAEAEAEACRIFAEDIAKAAALIEQAARARDLSENLRRTAQGLARSARVIEGDARKDEANAAARAEIHGRVA